MLSLWILLFLSYVGVTWWSLVHDASPARQCTTEECYQPLVSVGQGLTVELWLYEPWNGTKRYKWVPQDGCNLDLTIPESGKLPTLLTDNESLLCEVSLPSFARTRSHDRKEVKPLKAKFLFRLASTGKAVSTAPFELTRVKEQLLGTSWTSLRPTRPSNSRNLLQKPVPLLDASNTSSTSKSHDDNKVMWIPHLKYGRAPVRLRLVAEYRDFGTLLRNDGLKLPAWNHTTYAPIIYVDDLSLQRSAQLELAPPEHKKPPIKLRIKLGAVSPVVDALIRQLHSAFATVETIMPGEGIDEIRYFLQDEHLYRFVLTQIISCLHVWFDYLAFSEEIQHFRGRKNLSGLSTSSTITRLLCSTIITLYLLDGGRTSWIVLINLFGTCIVEAWKVWKLLQPSLKRTFPFIALRQFQTPMERELAKYDQIASSNLAMVLYPLVIGWSLYALQHYEYTSWYSWLISNLANVVYTFGFISLCPQLYVNYRLKSVAHLPWKVFMYKIFNTFVDDAFAWLIEMPLKHRIMTLRDDVVFLMFLFQFYIYRVDKTRVNEYGYSYQEETELKDKQA